MTREFKSFGALAEHLMAISFGKAIAMHEGLELAARCIERDAKDEIGHYQEAVGPFAEWEALADSTEAEKARLGFEPDAPLLRTGELRDTIGHEIRPLEAIVGSTSDVMVYQELGTEHIPPRPVLGPAAIHNQEKIELIIGAAVVSGLIGSERIHAALGYDFETEE